MADPVKGKTDAGRRREARARATRARIVAAATHLFVTRGYAATTVEAIAARAKVAPATVYQAFGTKHAVLARALDVAIVGDEEPVALLDRPWVQEARAERDPRRRLALVVARTSEVAARTAALKRAMRDAAATEPAVRALVRDDARRRHRTQRALVEAIVGDVGLRPGLDLAAATATFVATVNSETYELFVEQLGWSRRRWRSWLGDLLDHALFGTARDATADR